MTQETYEAIRLFLADKLAGTQFEGKTYFVGGCERDRILNNNINDIDIVVEIKNGAQKLVNYLHTNGLLRFSVSYENFGTVCFELYRFPDIKIEAVQTRKECYRDSSRNPEVTFGTIEDDCHRRDFTINALYRDICTGKMYDFNGNAVNDLISKTLYTCGDPNIIFTEDPLRILRAIRFAARFDFVIDPGVREMMNKHAYRLSIVSMERIKDEICKMLSNNNCDIAMASLDNMEVMKFVLPVNVYDIFCKGNFAVKQIKTIPFVSNIKTPNGYLVNLSYTFKDVSDDETNILFTYMKFSKNEISTINLYKKCINILLSEGDKEAHLREVKYLCKDNIALNDILCGIGIRSKSDERTFRVLASFNVSDKWFDYKLPVNGNDILEIRDMKIGGPIVAEILDELYTKSFTHEDGITEDYCRTFIQAY